MQRQFKKLRFKNEMPLFSVSFFSSLTFMFPPKVKASYLEMKGFALLICTFLSPPHPLSPAQFLVHGMCSLNVSGIELCTVS